MYEFELSSLAGWSIAYRMNDPFTCALMLCRLLCHSMLLVKSFCNYFSCEHLCEKKKLLQCINTICSVIVRLKNGKTVVCSSLTVNVHNFGCLKERASISCGCAWPFFFKSSKWEILKKGSDFAIMAPEIVIT